MKLTNLLRGAPTSFRALCTQVVFALGMVAVIPVLAAQPPSTGTIFKQGTPPPPLPAAPGPVLSLPAPEAQTGGASVNISVHRIVISGNTLVPTTALQPLVQSLQGHTITLADLHAGAARITALYHVQGYPLAYAYIPAQTIRDGVVKIAVIEPRYDRISITGHSRLKPARAHQTLGLKPGQPIAEAPLNRGLLLLNRTPGVRVAGTLVPGAQPATSTLQVEVSGEPLVRASLIADNDGNTYTGRARSGLNLSLDNPLGYGGQLAVNALTTEAGLLHSAGFNAVSPDLWHGLRANLFGSHTSYRLGGAFTSLQQSGYANQLGMSLNYPVLLQPGRLLTTGGDLLRNSFDQRNAAGTDNRSHISLMRLNVSGTYTDHWQGVTSGGISISRGVLSLDSADAEQSDAVGPNARGGFWISQFQAGHSQPLPSHLHLDVTLSGQLASHNLDGSEKFYLGGPYGVMSYPVGEAGGDQGLLLRARLSHPLQLGMPGVLQVSLLAQGGKVQVNRHVYPGFTDPNWIHLAGAGVGLDYHWQHRVSASLAYVHRLGATQATAGPDHHGEIWANAEVDF